MLDENLFRFNEGHPLLLTELAKQRLTQALFNDTLFLSSINVMDYSLLVGMVQRRAAEGEPAEWSLVVRPPRLATSRAASCAASMPRRRPSSSASRCNWSRCRDCKSSSSPAARIRSSPAASS